MKTTLLALTVVLSVGCGIDFNVHYTCQNTPYASVESVEQIDCKKFMENFDQAERVILESTSIDDHVFRSRMSHMHVHIRSVETWEWEGMKVSGDTSWDQMYIERHGWSIAHESLHGYDLMGYADDPGNTLLHAGGLNRDEMKHIGWESNDLSTPHGGFFTADHRFQQISEDLQPGTGWY